MPQDRFVQPDPSPASQSLPGSRLTALSRSVAGSSVIVTGAASGMGRSTALLFADEEANVILADRSADAVHEVARQINDHHGPGRALAVPCDVAEREQLRSLVDTAVSWTGRIDVVVNNAGVAMPSSFFADEEEYEFAWTNSLAVNLSAQTHIIRLALPHLQQAPFGRIVNIASTETIVTTSGLSAYAASKSGVIGLTKSLAVELGRHGITANCVCPGPIETGMTDAIDDEAKSAYAKRRVPLRRYGQPEEVAQMILNLSLPSSSYVNGAVICVDGGMSIRHI